MKKTIIAILSAIILLVGGGAASNQMFGGGGQSTISQTRAGSATQFTAMPESYVMASSTTTDAISIDTGSAGLVRQELLVDGITKFSFVGQAKGGTATSTLNVRPQISMDGTTFFDITGNSTSTDGVATTTGTILPQVFSFDPGVATSSFAYIFEIPAANYLRLLLMGDDLSTDPNDGVEAFIQVGLEQGN